MAKIIELDGDEEAETSPLEILNATFQGRPFHLKHVMNVMMAADLYLASETPLSDALIKQYLTGEGYFE